MRSPVIVATVVVADTQPDPELARRRIALYVEAIERHGGTPRVVDARATRDERNEAFASMDGLLLAGGADIHPSRYGQAPHPTVEVDDDRDALESAAWTLASARDVPVFGVCRGMQAINVFSGGSLLQHVDDHAGPGWGIGPARRHPIRVVPGSLIARTLAPGRVPGVVHVNSYHHQAVRQEDLAPLLMASAWASSPEGDIVEALEARDGRIVFGVQCHPERRESTPPEFERLWAFFVDACRGPAR